MVDEDQSWRSYGQQETQQLLRPSLLRPEELSMESGIDPGQDYYTQDYYNYDQGYDHPQYGSRRKLISPSGLYDEYGEVVVDDDGSYYYSPQESDTEHGHRKRRIKLTVDREYETSSTGDDSQSEHLRSRLPSTLNSHTNVNGGLYVAQNGSIIRTRRSVAAPTQTDNKPNSPVFSSRLTKHFKKLDKTACTPDEELPLSSGRSASDRGCNTLSTFKSPAVSSEINKTLTAINTRQSTLSLGSTNNSNTGQDCITIKLNVLKGPHGVEQPRIPEERDGVSERESKIDVRSDATEVTREPLECPSDRTQSDEEELWMGPWNNLHIPMTKL